MQFGVRCYLKQKSLNHNTKPLKTLPRHKIENFSKKNRDSLESRQKPRNRKSLLLFDILQFLIEKLNGDKKPRENGVKVNEEDDGMMDEN